MCSAIYIFSLLWMVMVLDMLLRAVSLSSCFIYSLFFFFSVSVFRRMPFNDTIFYGGKSHLTFASAPSFNSRKFHLHLYTILWLRLSLYTNVNANRSLYYENCFNVVCQWKKHECHDIKMYLYISIWYDVFCHRFAS